MIRHCNVVPPLSILTLLLALGPSLAAEPSPAAPRPRPLAGRAVVMVVAPELFRDEELQIPRRMFEGWGASVSVASSTTAPIRGQLGRITVSPDLLITAVDPASLDALVVVGGVGARVLWDDEDLLDLTRRTVALGKTVGAICLAPVVLARAGVLTGLPATVFHVAKAELVRGGAAYVDRPVAQARSGTAPVVTANGPAAAADFARAVARSLLPLSAPADAITTEPGPGVR